MSVDLVKTVPKIHKLSGLVSEVCIRHFFTLFVRYMCVNGGGRYLFKFVFACVSMSCIKGCSIISLGY